MDALLNDLRAAARALAKQPGSATVSVIILALGIGLSTSMFSLVYGVMFRGLDVPEADRVGVLSRVDMRSGEPDDDPMRGHDLLDFRERARSFEGLLGYYGGTVNLADDQDPDRYQGAWVTANTFDLLGIEPVVGRSFVAGEDDPGSPPAVLLGHHVWRDRYALDPAVVGRSVRVNGRQGTVVGVMPEGFKWPSNHALWITPDEDLRGAVRGEGRFFWVMGRLARDGSWDQANLEVARIADQLAQEWPDEYEGIS
ncbi:MAG: hypothetical protein HKO77_02700, partial [Gemmatimonadetes bacterium]|nr:hypothetical protein [Gemmatimonadota bacterium]